MPHKINAPFTPYVHVPEVTGGKTHIKCFAKIQHLDTFLVLFQPPDCLKELQEIYDPAKESV